MAMQIEVWGNFACFSRPEFKTERVSYDVMTPSAARGLVESVFWHPGLRYTIDKIHVLAPIRFASIRRNEVKSTVLASGVLAASSLNDYAEPGDEKQIWDIYKGNARVQR